jgi:adenylyltransferase/sulfurtransferase
VTLTLPLPETSSPFALSGDEVTRYSRHLLLPEVGVVGQQRLRDARVLSIGAGGLGSPLALYLAAAGVGTIGLVDFDVVDVSNLQRQVLHGTADVGRSKLDSARDRLGDLNPHVRVNTHAERLTSANAFDIMKPYDIVVDGTDNFATRFLINDACVILRKPNVYGSIFRFEGQLSVFDATRGPCYRCLFREAPPAGLVPSCAEGGVLGVLPGIIGSLQALETIKLILRAGDSMIGRLLLFDALELSTREVAVKKDPDCPVCGARPTITSLQDLPMGCALPARDDTPIPAMRPRELRDRLTAGDRLRLIDVRGPAEWNIVNLAEEGAQLIPLDQLDGRMAEIPRDQPLVVHCKGGARSAKAVRLLMQHGFERVWNLDGGILAWSEEVDPAKPRY